MKVTLLTYTPNALDVLLFTKNTRLTGEYDAETSMAMISSWSEEQKLDELRKMRHTIKSSWEFVDYTFSIERVTRAFTQQLERHRVGTSFAEQSLRAVDKSSFDYKATGRELNMGDADWTERPASRRDRWGSAATLHNPSNLYDQAMQVVDETYKRLLDHDVKVQDARGLLPLNVLTGLTFKVNLRALHEMCLKRLCVRTQGEFQDVVWMMIDEIIKVHPWAEPFFRVQCAWNGTCLFPLLPLDQCHVKPHVYNPETGLRYDEAEDQIEDFYLVPKRPATTAEIYQIHRSKRGDVQPPVSK